MTFLPWPLKFLREMATRVLFDHGRVPDQAVIKTSTANFSLRFSAHKHVKQKRDLFETEREGFEPSTEVASCNSLAGSRFQPLSHLSSSKAIVPRGLPNAQITRRGKRCLKLQSTSQGIESASSAHDRGLMVCSPSRPSRVTTSPLSNPLWSVASRIS